MVGACAGAARGAGIELAGICGSGCGNDVDCCVRNWFMLGTPEGPRAKAAVDPTPQATMDTARRRCFMIGLRSLCLPMSPNIINNQENRFFQIAAI
jgi:hypothetical protein